MSPTSNDSQNPSPGQAYQQRLSHAEAQVALLERRARRIGTLRLLCFLSAIALLIAAERRFPAAVPATLTLILGLLSVAGFIALVIRHGLVLDQQQRARHLIEINRQGQRRLDGTWAQGPITESSPAPPGQPPYAADLDLYGEASLFQLCDATYTFDGERALRQALCRAAEPDRDGSEALARQQAVRELGPLIDLRQALEVEGRVHAGVSLRRSGRTTGRDKPDPEPLLRWAEGVPLLSGRSRILIHLSRLPLLTVPLLLLATLLPWHVPGLLLLVTLLLVIQVGLLLQVSQRITEIITKVGSRETSLSAYGGMLTLLAEAPLAAPANLTLKEAVLSREGGVHGPAWQMRRLQGYYGNLQLRQNPLVWLPLNVLFLWDLYFALCIERWQQKVGTRVRGWLLALGELEARASLATLAHDNPHWAYPQVVPGPPCFSAEDLGHPLIPAGRRVGNDVALPGPGRAWLLTGSNMSGKSTLLRSIGLCQVMAQAGAPVCARNATLSPLRLRSVMRVDDSVSQGVSHFYAELRRLKQTLDAARPAQEGAPPLCYLLDEILHGTNTRERELGARAVIKTLCHRGTLGAVSTHDLSLATLEQETGGAVVNVHFTETVQGAEMTFDYRLRPGPVQTTNALRLMRLCGMDLDWAELREEA